MLTIINDDADDVDDDDDNNNNLHQLVTVCYLL